MGESFKPTGRATHVELIRTMYVRPTPELKSAAISGFDVSGLLREKIDTSIEGREITVASYFQPVEAGCVLPGGRGVPIKMPSGFVSIGMVLDLEGGDRGTASHGVVPTLYLVGDPDLLGETSLDLVGRSVPMTDDFHVVLTNALTQFEQTLASI